MFYNQIQVAERLRVQCEASIFKDTGVCTNYWVEADVVLDFFVTHAERHENKGMCLLYK